MDILPEREYFHDRIHLSKECLSSNESYNATLSDFSDLDEQLHWEVDLIKVVDITFEVFGMRSYKFDLFLFFIKKVILLFKESLFN